MEMPRAGELFDGRYQIESVLGEGGFAVVYRALDTRLGQKPVALKVLRPDDGAGYQLDTRRRFDRELGVLGRLRHPHIIDELDAGIGAQGHLYVTFELLAGRDLSHLLREAGRLSPIVVAGLLRQLLSALDAAHTAGLLHRDLKPPNVRVIEEHRDFIVVKLLDFGIARSTDDGHPSITKMGELIGTPRYMSPEQLRGKPLSPSSDLYSLGLMAFELLVGTHVLSGNSLLDQMDRVLGEQSFSVPELERTNPGFLAILQRMAHPDPAARFQTARAVMSALDQLGEGGGFLPRPIATAPRWDGSMAAPAERPTRERVHSKAVARVAFASCVALVSGWILFARSNEPPTATDGEAAKRAPTGIVKSGIATPPTRPRVDAGPSDAEVTAIEAPPIVFGVGVPSSGCVRQPRVTEHSGMPILPLESTNEEPMPLVVVLGDPRYRASELLYDTGFNRSPGIVLIAPPPTTPPKKRHPMWGEPEHDVPYLKNAVDGVMKSRCIDSSRVFIVGYAEGGRAAVAASRESWVSAVALYAYNLRWNKHDPHTDSTDLQRLFSKDIAKPALWLWPNASSIAPTKGRDCDERDVIARERTEELWRERNRCGDALPARALEGATCQGWNCEALFVSCLVDGGSSWPGVPPLLLDGCERESAPDFPIVHEILAFFARVVPSNSAAAPR